ncbi:hypothetical protein [Aristaeella hokkaidonensis]|uniref:Uncharacterized protein n=1 Tax=Aristaeella hokkaidonensis TaxID=3046382 RepID=A0AC61MY21_9FIRM|nr:hypothetical protein [Aristaeella hokkaidonensis]QUC67947.1 hypothetical protein JYE49_04395 [Aristaeella hokkaidonensis]
MTPATAFSAQSKAMPQKPVFARAPILAVSHCFPCNGTIRTTDESIKNLYVTAGRWIDNPYLWEGLFRVACLIKNKPMEEPVTALILNAVRDTENGSAEGCLSRQISIIRAAFAVYEYNTDRMLLQRLAVWCHYLEIEFEHLIKEDPEPLYKPADLMEFLVRFYQVTGLKAVLRICTRLRAAAFNWTSALHTFQQSIPVCTDELHPVMPELTEAPEDIDYDEKEKLINHAEMLADGIRYSVFSGIFSGNGQDLAAGKVVWRYLRKHHHALCGGTTSNPYLCGNAPEQPISNCTVAAWVEAFASQLILEDSEWALDELIRIVFNSLEDCLNKERAGNIQKVNGSAYAFNQSGETADLYARLTRAAAVVYQHAVTLKEKGICVNYTVPGKFLLMIRKQAVILNMNEDSLQLQCKKTINAYLDVFIPVTGTSVIKLTGSQEDTDLTDTVVSKESGYYVHLKKEWQNQDGVLFEDTDRVISEDTHHQGICYIHNNRLYALPVKKDDPNYAVHSGSEIYDGGVKVSMSVIPGTYHPDKKTDIPVLPVSDSQAELKELIPYSRTKDRMTMFPRIKTHV